MNEPDARISIGGYDLEWPPRDDTTSPRSSVPFLQVHYRCCNAYGRLVRNADETAYEGRCPKCGRTARALIGPDGTSQRTFEARRV